MSLLSVRVDDSDKRDRDDVEERKEPLVIPLPVLDGENETSQLGVLVNGASHLPI